MLHPARAALRKSQGYLQRARKHRSHADDLNPPYEHRVAVDSMECLD